MVPARGGRDARTSGSIRRNIASHDPTLDLAQIHEAAHLAAIHEEIADMPMGYETLIAEGGGDLAGGQRQRLAIARAIINQPEVILADEPTGNLDPGATYEIVEILKKINDLGTTVILTTHNKGIIDSLGKRVITLEKGRIVKDDKHGKHSM